jgi:hypothetical protein
MKASLRKRTFSPLQAKEIESVLLRLFVDEFGYENKVVFARAMIQRILKTLAAFMEGWTSPDWLRYEHKKA